jgi:hypothetical protein
MRIKNEKRLETAVGPYRLFTKQKYTLTLPKISSPLPRTKPQSGDKYL